MNKLLLTLLILLLSACEVKPPAAQRVLTLKQADFLILNQQKPPSDAENNWKVITLPDLWDIQRPDISAYGWYRFSIHLNVAPNRLWGIYLPRVNKNVAVFINDTLIGNDAYFQQPFKTSWNTPQYFTIPNGILHAGENIIYLRIFSDANMRGRLLPVELGPDVTLSEKYSIEYFHRITLSQIIAVFTFATGIVIALIWYFRRTSEYFWFSLGSLLWTFYTCWFFVQNIPIKLPIWAALTNSSSIWSIACMWFFVMAHADINLQTLRKYILIYCAFITLILLLLPNTLLFTGIIIGHLILFFLTAPIFLAFIKQYLSHINIDNSIIFISIMPMIILGVHDWLNITFRLQHHYLLHYSIPFIFLLMGWALLRRFTRAVNEAERLNNELEIRVKNREQELTQAFETIKELEKKKALEKERERIMRDIHDGVGGQLVSALAIIENEKPNHYLLADTLNFALDDLRLIIDSLAPDENNLEDMLYMFKYRYEPRLQHYGIMLNWKQDDNFTLPDFSPHHCLQVLRILQEVFNNILKHASTQKISVTLLMSQVARIKIQDNGIGFPDPLPNTGRGINNIKKRARDMNITVDFYNHKGACVEIIFNNH